MSTLKVSGTFINKGKEQVMSLLSKESREEDSDAKGVMFIAIGDGSPTTEGLGHEVGRRGIYSVTKDADGSRIFRSIFESGYPNIDVFITEAGIVCGGSLTTGTGTCIAVKSLASSLLKRNIDYLYLDYKLYFE